MGSEIIVLNDIPFHIEEESFLMMLHLDSGSREADEVRSLIRDAEKIAKPKALYMEAYIDEKGEDAVAIEGKPFKSRIMRINLGEVYKVYPYVLTCGRELEEWARCSDDLLVRFWADKIMESALAAATTAFESDLADRYSPGKTSVMNPGSLEDWPIDQQRILFDLLGDPYEAVGVRLTETFLMLPVKSVSGICFPSDVDFVSCELCPRENCPGRRRRYNKEAEERYVLEEGCSEK